MVLVLLSSAHHATTIDQPHGEMSTPGQSILCPELRQLRTIEKNSHPLFLPAFSIVAMAAVELGI
jgi:hypothetical protein